MKALDAKVLGTKAVVTIKSDTDLSAEGFGNLCSRTSSIP